MITFAKTLLLLILGIVGAVMILAAAYYTSMPATAQECTPMAAAAANLKERYGENPTVGLTIGPNMPAMIFVNHETGTWTMLVGVDGCARIVAAGERWTQVNAEPGEGA